MDYKDDDLKSHFCEDAGNTLAQKMLDVVVDVTDERPTIAKLHKKNLEKARLFFATIASTIVFFKNLDRKEKDDTFFVINTGLIKFGIENRNWDKNEYTPEKLIDARAKIIIYIENLENELEKLNSL